MPAKTTSTPTVRAGYIVHVDPDHGIHAPDADALAARGVVTASARAHRPGDTLDEPAETVAEAVTRPATSSRPQERIV